MPLVTVTAADGVAVVTLNRADARNALSAALLRELVEACAFLGADDGVRAVVLTGADPAFCAGLDLRELGRGEPGLLGSDVVGALTGMGKPVIGAVNGPAVTGGLELALACDFRIASDRARFADTHARVGIVPGWGLTVRLPLLIGTGWARQMSCTGNYVDAATALRIGLVNDVVAHDALLDTAVALGRDIASCDAAALGEIRRLYDEVAGVALPAALALEHRASQAWAQRLQPGAVEERRDAVTARGRAQQQAPGRGSG
jgi:enoyl-CoA hydratase